MPCSIVNWLAIFYGYRYIYSSCYIERAKDCIIYLINIYIHTYLLLTYDFGICILQSEEQAFGLTLPPQNHNVLRRKHLAEGTLFEDPYFPAANESVFYSHKPPNKFEWKRPQVYTPSMTNYLYHIHILNL